MSPTNQLTTSAPLAGRRRAGLAAAVAGLCILAGGAGAAASMLGRGASPAPTVAGLTASTPSGPSIYIPGQSDGSGSGTGQQSSGSTVPMRGAPGAAMAPAALSAAPSMGVSMMPPYGGFCSPPASAQVSAHTVTATSMARIGTPATPAQYVLSANVTNQGGSDAAAAVADVQHRLNAVEDALVRAGLPRSAIHVSEVSLWANSGPLTPVDAAGKPAGGTTVSANAGLTADLPDAGSVERMVNAASAAGASSVYVNTQVHTEDPSSDALDAAIGKATDAAHQLDTSAARAAGAKLGALHALSVQPPVQCGWGPDGPDLVVAVTVAYDLA